MMNMNMYPPPPQQQLPPLQRPPSYIPDPQQQQLPPLQRPPSYMPDPKFNQTLHMSIIHPSPQPSCQFNQTPPGQVPSVFQQRRQNSCFTPSPDPNIIVVEKRQTFCYRCSDESPGYLKKTPGCVTFTWATTLLIFGTWMCCVPFFVDGCLDTEEVCTKCGTVRNTTKANCL